LREELFAAERRAAPGASHRLGFETQVSRVIIAGRKRIVRVLKRRKIL